jgi:N-methylhydantoinase A
MTHEGYGNQHLSIRRLGDFRYAGQAYELTVPFSETLEESVEAFHGEHERTFGYRSDTSSVDLINVRVEFTVGETGGSAEALSKLDSQNLNAVSGGSRKAYFGRAYGMQDTPILGRTALSREWRSGPFIIEEYDATCVIPPDARARIDRFGNIEIRFA